MFINKNYDNYPPYWVKVKIIYDIINNTKYNDYDGFIWVDSDAVFTNKNILSLVDNYHTFYISPDPYSYNYNTISDIYDSNSLWYHKIIFYILNNINNIYSIVELPLCVGVFLVKNNDIGKKIINNWWEKYNHNKWTKKNNKWETDGVWAGVDYEQGSFNEYIYPKFKKHIKILHSSVLSDIDSSNSNSFVSHYMGSRKKYIDIHYKN
jgi:hypothetical protein